MNFKIINKIISNVIGQYGVQKYLLENLMKYICTKLGNNIIIYLSMPKTNFKICIFSLLEHIFNTYLKQILHLETYIYTLFLKTTCNPFFMIQNLKIMHNNEKKIFDYSSKNWMYNLMLGFFVTFCQHDK
jgi:hypothetical protein